MLALTPGKAFCLRFAAATTAASLTTPAVLASRPATVGQPDPGYTIGAGGWIVEQFGSDVAILRAPVGGELPVGDQAALLVSCSGDDRRVRLSFPRPIGDRSRPVTVASAFIWPVGSSDKGSFAAMRFALSGAAVAVSAEPASKRGDIAVAIGRMLLKAPRALDVLLSPGAKPLALGHLLFYRLPLVLDLADAAAVRRFVSACTRSSFRSSK